MRIPVTILAVLLAFQANAQSENKITVSGRAWGSVENVSTALAAGGTDVQPRYRVTNNASFVRIRGDQKVSDDLSAFGQVEAQFALDGVGAPFDLTRNTGVGFSSKTYGTIVAGRWDSPYKLAVINLDPWGNTTILNYANVLGQMVGSGNIYDSRLTNGVQYWSPVFNGVQFKAAAVVNEDKSSQINPSVFSFSLAYTGPVYLAVAYETRKDCAGANGTGAPACTGALLYTHGRDWGVRAGAGYKFAPTRTEVGVVYEHLESEGDNAGLELTLKRDAYYASLVQGLMGDAHQLVGAVGVASKTSGTYLASNDNTGAMYYTLAYRYNFNKDLFVYGGYVQIRNDAAANYRFTSSGFTGAAAVPNTTGANISGWTIGTRYLF